MIIFEHHVKNGKHISFEWYRGKPIKKLGGGSWNDNNTHCGCSYCTKWGKGKIHYGLNCPKGFLSSNGWYVLKIWKYTYIRFNFINLGKYVNIFFK